MVKNDNDMTGVGQAAGTGGLVGAGIGELLQAGPIGWVLIVFYPLVLLARKLFRRHRA